MNNMNNMNNSDLIDLLTTCKTICGTEAKFYSRFKKGSVHAVMPSKFAAIDNALDKAIAALSKEPAKLPEVKAFLENSCTTIDNLDDSTWVIEVDHVDEFLGRLTAAHAAELAAIEHERSGVEGAMYARILALEAELAEKEKTK